MRPLAAYLAQLQLTRATQAHTAETSFHPALKGLLDAVGARLSPRVVCVMNLRAAGAGLPDGGLFSAERLDGAALEGADEAMTALRSTPDRGAIEVKPPSVDMQALAVSTQVTRYGTRYRHVLISNLREFWLVEHDDGQCRVRERHSLAGTERELWHLASHPAEADAKEPALLAFLERVLRTPAPVAAPEDVAWFLASYARDALAAIEHAPTGAMDDLAEALGTALGVGFRDAKGKHFFHSTLVQTIFYGVFSAWVLWSQQPRSPADRFRWRDTTDLLHLPILKVLFHEMTRPALLFTRALRERIDLAEVLLNRVDRAEFHRRFPLHEAVQYFYEPFLEAFDPELRREMGVWYTPDEVVRYMVERVDRALRDDLGIEEGLADPSVLVLDPACGTGAFLLAVVERIARTLDEQGRAATTGARLAEAITKRLHGFEILPAPFVIAHLQLSLHLQRLGVRLSEGQRAGVYLTNALTGWGKATGPRQRLPKELAEERTAANGIKQRAPVLVVLGNPPYNAFSGVQDEEEQESVDVYKVGLVSAWKVRKFNLDDLYVRFFRLAERKIAEQSGRGVVCFISNASYATDPSFVVMRERFVRRFDAITIDNLNGDSRETGKLTPDGRPDPSIFSTARNREGIRVGTAIGLFTLKGRPRSTKKKGARPDEHTAAVKWRDFWGAGKRQALLASLDEPDGYRKVEVDAAQKWSFAPRKASRSYRHWTAADELCEHPRFNGLAEKRRASLIAIDRDVLEARMRAYFDASKSWREIQTVLGGLAIDAARYPAELTRRRLLDAGDRYESSSVRRYTFMCLDSRYCYHSLSRPLWNEPRPGLATQLTAGNRALVYRKRARRPDEGLPSLMVSALPDDHVLDPNVDVIPIRWRVGTGRAAKFTANLSPKARAYLDGLGYADVDTNEQAATVVWFHYLAVLHSPRYLSENGEAVRADVPRVPLPATRAALERSAALGRRIADLMDADRAVPGVTAGVVDPALRPLGALRKTDGTQIDPAAGDLALTARWATLQRGSVVMPGPGRISPGRPLQDHPLGPETVDVWLNDRVCWGCVPRSIWEAMVGGYPVIKKWLSYRERSVLGRDLSLDEAEHVTSMVRRLAALQRLGAELDDSYLESMRVTWQPGNAPAASWRDERFERERAALEVRIREGRVVLVLGDALAAGTLPGTRDELTARFADTPLAGPTVPVIDLRSDGVSAMLAHEGVPVVAAGAEHVEAQEALLARLGDRGTFVIQLRGELKRTLARSEVADLEIPKAVLGSVVLARLLAEVANTRSLVLIGVAPELVAAAIPGLEASPGPHFAFTVDAREFPALHVLPLGTSPDDDDAMSALRWMRRAEVNVPMASTSPKLLESVSLTNIGSYEEVRFSPAAGWSVLLGPNGHGKTSILRAIALGLVGDDPRAQPHAASLLRAGASSGAIELILGGRSFRTELTREGNAVRVTSGASGLGPLQSLDLTMVGFPALRGAGGVMSAQGYSTDAKARPEVEDLLPLIAGDTDRRIATVGQWLAKTRLAAVLTRPRDPAAAERLDAAVDRFFSMLVDLLPGISLKLGEIDPLSGKVHVVSGGDEVPIGWLSQGTTAVLGWIGTVLLRLLETHPEAERPERSNAIVLVDEIDAHMHPEWQQALVGLVRECMPNLQVIATSHSPLVVGSLGTGRVFKVPRITETRRVHLEPLTEHFEHYRADQILTSEAFGLDHSVSDGGVALLDEYARLNAKADRSPEEEDRFRSLETRLHDEVPAPPETEAAREAMVLVERALHAQQRRDPERVRTEARRLLALLERDP